MGNNEKQENARYSTLQNFIYVMQGCKKWHPSILICMLIQAVAGGISLYVWIYGVKLVISEVEQHGMEDVIFANIVRIVLITAAIEAVLMIVAAVTSKWSESEMIDVRFSFIRMWMKKIMNMDYPGLENPKVLDARRRSIWAMGDMLNGIEGIQLKANVLGVNLVSAAVAVVLLQVLNPIVVFVLLLLSFIRFRLIDKMVVWEKRETRDNIITEHRRCGYYTDIMSDFDYAKDIRLFRMWKPLMEKLQGTFDLIHKRVCQAMDKWKVTYTKSHILEMFQEGILYIWLIFEVLRNDLSIADFTLYLGSIRNFVASVDRVLEQWAMMKNDSRLIEDYRTFLEFTEEAGLEENRSSFKTDYEKWGYEHGIKDEHESKIPCPEDGKYVFHFENVSFRYPGSNVFALKNLTLTLEAGNRLAVVGLNGAGKSTFVKLLCRLYEPTEGTITMNGVDISTYNRKDYFRLIAPVFQDVETFAFPLAENVSMHPKEETDRELVNSCLQNSGLEADVRKLPKGIDTELWKTLYEDGIDLSGGQKQKLTLARALYKDSPIVILDEPTAALDAIAEYESYMNFDRLIGNKTAVYISHRLSSTRFCHAIAMFQGGELIEYGTHEELMRKNGAYREMYDVQAQYYRKGEARV